MLTELKYRFVRFLRLHRFIGPLDHRNIEIGNRVKVTSDPDYGGNVGTVTGINDYTTDGDLIFEVTFVDDLPKPFIEYFAPDDLECVT